MTVQRYDILGSKALRNTLKHKLRGSQLELAAARRGYAGTGTTVSRAMGKRRIERAKSRAARQESILQLMGSRRLRKENRKGLYNRKSQRWAKKYGYPGDSFDVIDMDSMLGGRKDLLRSRKFLQKLKEVKSTSAQPLRGFRARVISERAAKTARGGYPMNYKGLINRKQERKLLRETKRARKRAGEL